MFRGALWDFGVPAFTRRASFWRAAYSRGRLHYVRGLQGGGEFQVFKVARREPYHLKPKLIRRSHDSTWLARIDDA